MLTLKIILIMKTTTHMATNIPIQVIWNSLKSNKTYGLVKQLYNSNLSANIYAIYKYPENLHGISVSFNRNIKLDISSFSGLKELDISIINDASLPQNQMLCIQLIDSGNLFVFATLCEDLISSIGNISDEKILVRSILCQLEKWRNLFECSKKKELSESEQLGLFGELTFLQYMLQVLPTRQLDVLHTWMGVEKSNKDFQGNEWAVEVKSSIGRKNKVTINGETQLDSNIFKHLILCHYSIERNNANGLTLPQLIDAIENLLKYDQMILNYFRARLMLAEYMPEDRTKYELRHYNIKKRDLYSVTSDFPRIVQDDLRKGVHDVTYTIMLDVCGSFLISENKLLQIIKQL